MSSKVINLFKKIYDANRYTLKRFPTAIVATLVISFFTIKQIWNSNSMSKGAESFCLVACWVFFFSVMVQLALELFFQIKQHSKSQIIELAAQGLILICFLSSGYFLIRETSARFFLYYWGIIIVFALAILQLLSRLQSKEVVIPNCIVSAFISGIISSFICGGIILIQSAFELLILGLKSPTSDMTESVAVVCFCILMPFLFLSYATKQEGIVIPKVFKVIQCYVLFPVYLFLVLILFGYIFRVVIIWKLPVGQFNYFISIATVLFLFFYLTLSNYKNRVIAFFYRFGALFMLVLILFQFWLYLVRVNAYGFTALRYASLLYIIFSIIFALLPLIKGGRYMEWIYFVFALFVLFATFTPLNILDLPAKNQNARIMSVLKKHDLKITAEGIEPKIESEDFFSYEEKVKISEAYKYLSISSGKKANWFAPLKEKKKTFFDFFGFDKIYEQKGFSAEYVKRYVNRNDYALDVSGYNKLYLSFFHEYSKSEGEVESDKILVKAGESEFDITEPILNFIKTSKKYSNLSDCQEEKEYGEPFIFLHEGRKFVVTSVYYCKSKRGESDSETVVLNFDFYMLE